MAMSKLRRSILATNRYNAMMTVTNVPPKRSYLGVLKAVLLWSSVKQTALTMSKADLKVAVIREVVTNVRSSLVVLFYYN